MCGIFSIFNKTTPISLPQFNQALRTLDHRGPDEFDSMALHDDCLALGHTRLSIIGVNNGLQPLFNQIRSTFAIVNGEFYDYKKTKQTFSSDGYPFQTESDSEIIIPLYQRYGLDCFKMLNGEYAGIIYDRANNSLISFRDRHGVKPLYFKKSDSGIAFSSEIKAILNYYGVRPEHNLSKLKNTIFGQPWDQDETLFDGIFNVKPGHILTYNLNTGAITHKPYWHIDYDKNDYMDVSLDEAVNGYEPIISKAVERRLVSDVPVASYLSGGIDSSACYGIASTIKGEGIDAFTISFDQKDYDEFSLAQQLVKKYNGKHHVLNVNEKILSDNLDKHLWHLEGIAFNPHGVAKHLLSNLVRENGFKVVLTGEGADEYNCGYITSIIDAMTASDDFDKSIIDEKIEVNKGTFLADNAEDLEFIKSKLGHNLSFISNHVSQARLMNSLLSENLQQKDPTLKFKEHFDKYYTNDMKNWDPLNVSLYFQSISTFSYVLTTLGDRTEMAHSVEARVPFLDNDVINYIRRINPRFKFYNGVDKYLLRKSCQKYVTRDHFETKKHPYVAPPASGGKSYFTEMMYDEFSGSSFKHMGLFEQSGVLKLLDQQRKNPSPSPFIDRILFTILSTSRLHKMFGFKSIT